MKVAVKDQPEFVRVRPASVVERNGFLYYRNPVRGGAVMADGDPVSESTKELIRDQIF